MNNSELTKAAVSATLHCLAGCAIGEVMGMVLGAVWGLSNLATVLLAIMLAFLFGYALSLWSVLRSGVSFRSAIPIVLAADTLSITVMEIVDNLVIVMVPGALDAHITDMLFWAALVLSLAIAFVVTVPVNRWLIARGKGHAVMHEHHEHHH